ncbi:MAG: LemA family protein [Candidatus Coprovivens sp.]
MEGVYLILIGCIVILIFIVSIYNSIVGSYKKVERSRSLVDIYLKKRFDLIPNLVETVKAYSKHEEETLKAITILRSNYDNNSSSDDANKLNAYYKKCIALIEAYPELKASESYLNLQKELSKVESEIESSRRIYSTDITRYNTKIQTFPTNIFASIFGYKAIEPISFDTEEVKIEL